MKIKTPDFEIDLDDPESNKEIKMVNLDLDLIKSNIPTYSSEKLSEMIVCERYLGFHPDVSVMCMEELARRRMTGDCFAFEDYIENALKKLPKLDFNVMDLRGVLLNAINVNKANSK